jgi:hypothetical protein
VHITNPPAGSTVNGTVSINANVTGAVGNSNTFTFMVDSTVLSTQTTSGTSAATNWNTNNQSAGSHTLTVKVTDADLNDPNAATGSTSEQVTVSGTITTYSISGTITNGAGATVALSGTSSGSTTADSSGNYTLSGLSNGTYTVTPRRSGYTFSPASQSVTVSGANVTAVNFTGSPSGGGNIAFVQGNNAFRGSSVSSLAAAYSNAQTAGNTNIVVVYAANQANWTPPGISSVVDNINGNYTLVGRVGGADVSAYIYRFSSINSASAGANKVTVTMAAAVPQLGISVFEYSGLTTSSPLDGTVQNSARWSANASITPVSTTNAKDLIFAVAVGDGNQQFTAGTGYTLRAENGNWPCVGVEDQITSSAGSYSASFTNGIQNWAGLCAAFH